MQKIQISIPKVEDIVAFVEAMNNLDFNVTLTNGHYNVSAKSLMVILAMDTTTGIYVYADDDKYTTQLQEAVETYAKG